MPGNNDHVTISAGDSVYHNNQETVRRLRIESGAVLYSISDMRVNRSYTLFGAHRGSARVRLRQNTTDSIIGTGFIKTDQASRIDNARQIYPGSSITIKSTDLRLPNNGTLTMVSGGSFTGNGSGTLLQGTGSTLTSDAVSPIPGGSLDASANNNLLVLNAGTSNQLVPVPSTSYYNLTLNGTTSIKSLEGRIKIDHDLKVDGPTLSAVDTFSMVLGRDFDLVDGIFDAQDGKVEFNGSVTQSIKGFITFHDVRLNSAGGVAITQDSMQVMGSLWLDAGSFNTNDRLTILSNAGGDGSIGPVTGGSISGDVTMQRYIDQGATNWRFLGSPTTNAQISDWIDDFISSGFPGSQFPSYYFESIRGYDETVLGYKDSGFVSVTSTDNLTSGTGFWVYSGDSLGGTSPFTIDVTGPVYQGAMNFSVTYTGTVGDTNNGWNLLANPSPSAIDWDHPSWNRTNVNNSIYMWNSDQDQYSSYVGGVGTNNGSNIIPQGHGFYVKASNTPAALSVDEPAKIDTTVGFLRPRKIEDLLVRFRLKQGSFSDETVIRSNTTTSIEFDSDFDAYHFPAGGRNTIQLFSRVGKYDYTINTLDLNETDTVPSILLVVRKVHSSKFKFKISRQTFVFISGTGLKMIFISYPKKIFSNWT